jgi:hypothetical protein
MQTAALEPGSMSTGTRYETFSSDSDLSHQNPDEITLVATFDTLVQTDLDRKIFEKG